jgi:subtilisin family serine protease
MVVATFVLTGSTGVQGAGGASTDEVYPTFDTRSEVASSDSFSRLAEIASRDGSVRAIVELQTRFTAEGALDRSGATAQEDEIKRAADALLAALPSDSYRLERRYRRLPFLALEMEPAGLAALERSGLAAHVGEDEVAWPTLAQTTPLVESTEANAFNITGDGQTIAILDTGVDAGHPFFGGRVVAEACFSEAWNCPGPPDLPTCQSPFGNFLPSNWVPAGSCPFFAAVGPGAGQPCTYAPISCQHGTHVAGIAAGSNGSFNGQTFSGVAPGASIVSINIYSSTNNPSCPVPAEVAQCPGTYESDQLAALELVYDTKDAFNYAAVNMSFGSTATYAGVCDNLFPDLRDAILQLRQVGIATVVSAGNGINGVGVKTGISKPACISWTVSVGATTKTDTVAPYSNSASILDLLAPGGTNLVANGQVTSSIPVSAGSWAAFQGTSMAAPHVAGAYAVLRDWAPSTTVGGLQNILKATGLPIVDPGNGLTKPRIRLISALVKLGLHSGLYPSYNTKVLGGKVVSSGVGLRRTDGQPASNTITVNGVSTGATVQRAFLYWMTVGNADPSIFLDGNAINGTLLGVAPSPCETAANNGATRVYRADVTTQVIGNGSYSLAGVGKPPGIAEGASLVLITRQASSTATNQITIEDGALTALPGDTATVSFDLASAIAYGDLHVGFGAGNSDSENPMTFGGVAITPANYLSGSDGPSWDDRSVPLKGSFVGPIVSSGITTGTDCLTWAYTSLTRRIS